MTSYWWVNQGDTFEAAQKLGVLWAPKLDGGGRPQRHWDSLTQTRVGDIVFHYSHTKLRGVSHVVSPCRDAQISSEYLEKWDQDGREVKIEPQDFDFEIGLEEIPLEIRTVISVDVNTPFDKHGKVKQGYLFALTTPIVEAIIKAIGQRIDWFEGEVKADASAIVEDFQILVAGETDTQIVSTGRREQGLLRRKLFRRKATSQCALCGNFYPVRLLHTAHIKKRNSCSRDEKLDFNVVMAACVLGCDALFENGYIVVSENGLIEPGKPATTDDLKSAVDYLVGNRPLVFGERTAKYFQWHKGSFQDSPS